jgi:hypothetical protein
MKQEYEIYCDESRPESLAAHNKVGKYVLIGGIWINKHRREEIKTCINEIKIKHRTLSEIKWSKVSSSRIGMYKELIDMFISFGLDLRFRCIIIDAAKVDLFHYHDNDQELGFYKFYYQLIHHWIEDFCSYSVFCDLKSSRRDDRLSTLQKCLNNSNLSSEIKAVQALPSHEVVFIQLVDLLLGSVSSRVNESINARTTKNIVVEYLEQKLGIPALSPTSKCENKFNIFKIQLS